MGSEGSRRGPSRINTVEDALREIVRNARDAGAQNIYVASVLKRRRFRTLTVIDDGCGIPESHRYLIFEPGVTTRHLAPVHDFTSHVTPHGAGLSLYHIRRVATSAEVTSNTNPTAIRITFDTDSLPERALQSGSRPSRSNQEATLLTFLESATPGLNQPTLYLASPARILATLLDHRIIHRTWLPGHEGARGVIQFVDSVGLGISARTVQRVINGEVLPVRPLSRRMAESVESPTSAVAARKKGREDGPSLVLGSREVREISDILGRSARASYLDVGDLTVTSRAGEIVLKARVFEPEEEYE